MSSNQISVGWTCQPQTKSSISSLIRKVDCRVSFEADPGGPTRDLTQLHPRLFGFTMDCTTQKGGIDKVSSISIQPGRGEIYSNQRPGWSSSQTGIFGEVEYNVWLDNTSWKKLARDTYGTRPVTCVLKNFLPVGVIIEYDLRKREAHHASKIIIDIWGKIVQDWQTTKDHWQKKLKLEYKIESRNKLEEEYREIPQSVVDYLSESLEISKQGFDPLTPMAFVELGEMITDLIEQQHRGAAFGIEDEPRSLPSELEFGQRYIEEYFTWSLKYLGPLRDEPKSLYPLSNFSSPTDIGIKGEYTASVLDLHKEQRVLYVPSNNFSMPELKAESTYRTLEAAVHDWLVYMGVANSVTTIDLGKLGHKMQVTTSDIDMPQDLTHVGVGVSQVLPILVMCLLAEQDTTLIIEQPELHLHPKVQTLLGDFFLSMALLGKQCIIETHSEYIINRLRFRAAAAQKDTISSLMKIYFVQKEDGASVFDPVNVNEYGAIPKWPEGFFDQSQSEAEEILRAATLKRKKERGENKDA